jgi:hypothetical protein
MIGRTLSHYKILSEISRGGMGQPGNGCLSRGSPPEAGKPS